MYVICKINEYGNLEITLTPEGEEYLTELLESCRIDDDNITTLQEAFDGTDVHTPNGLVMGPRTKHNTEITKRINYISQYKLNDAEIFQALFEGESEFEFVTPEETGDLTDALILTNDAERDDHGELVSVGNKWAYNYYMVYEYWKDLKENGYVIWLKGQE